MPWIRSRLVLATALLLALLTSVSLPVRADPSYSSWPDDASGSPARLVGEDSLAGGSGLSSVLEQSNPNPPSIHVCKLAGQIPSGTLVTIQLSGTHNNQPLTITNTFAVGTVCSQNEFTNYGNQFDLNSVVSLVETAPPNARLLPGPPFSGACTVVGHAGNQDFALACGVSPTGVASFTLDANTGGGQIDVVLANGGADLRIGKLGPIEGFVGQDVNYDLLIVNDGPEAAINARVTDTLPASFAFQSATPSQGTCSGPAPGSLNAVVTCAFGTIPNAASVTVKISARPTTTGVFVNTATVASDTPDPHSADDTATFTTTVNAAPTFTPTSTVTMTPTFTPTSTFTVTPTSTPTGPTLTPTPTTTGTIFTSTPTTTRTPTSTSTSPSTPTATSTGTITPTPAADLAILKLAAPEPVHTGQDLNYFFSILNEGPSNATGVVVTDPLPPNTTFVSASSDQGTCTLGGTTVTCAIGNMAVGSILNLRITVRPTAAAGGTTLTNTATIAGNEFDQHPADNTSTFISTVLLPTLTPTQTPLPATQTVLALTGTPTPLPATQTVLALTGTPTSLPATATAGVAGPLTITKTGSPATVNVGDQVTYTLTIRNLGATPATGVTVTDTLPVNATFVSATATVGTCAGTATVTCTIGTLAAGASATVTIIVTPTEAAAGTTLTNTAVARGSAIGPVTATTTTTVLADLIGQITCNIGTSPGFVAVLSRRLSGTPGESGSFSLLGLRSDSPNLAQVLPGDLTAQADLAGNFHFSGLPPSTTFALTILTLDGTVVVRETVSTPAAGAVHFSRSLNCLAPFPPLPPLLPPPPPAFLPPPPAPLIPVLPSAVQGAVAPVPEVPVIPEADSLLLLGGGLVLGGILAALRARRRRGD